ncbi:segregation/condensation protein A [Candidatus Parcubacteria bacterium]|nr:segregation/condensation protein A [Candidatus Parcubacteria bacterium]
MYQVSTQQFTGPLDLLLQLVEKKNLAITELSLAQVTQEYVAFLNEQEEINPEDLADFLVIASTLLLIKSRSLLPSLVLAPEEETEIMDLETRLKIYKLYKEAGGKIKEMFKKEIYVLNRPSWKNIEPKFSPPSNCSLESLNLAFLKILKEIQIEKAQPLAEKKIQKIASLEERIKELIQKITSGKMFRLLDLTKEKQNKIDLILTFLAALHLAKQKIIKIKQKDNFGEIWISNQS